MYFAGAPVAVLQGTNEYYVHTDHLGTPRVASDGDTVIWRWASDPFGRTVAQEDPDGDSTLFTYNLRFPGQYYDAETGMHYNYFRTYDPSTGRYLESDPIGLGGGLNTYGYVGGNALSFIDPLGLDRSQYYTDAMREAFHRAMEQHRAQKAFEKYQELCLLYGGTNCDAPQDCPIDEASVDAWRTFIDIFSLSSGAYGTSRIPSSRLTVRPNVPYESRWNYGSRKSADKWARQMQQRGWTESQVSEALSRGQAQSARNNINPANGATRYVHPETGRSVVIDNTTREIIHVGGDGYRY